MGNQQSTRCRPARLVGDRPELNRILPHQMGGGILVRLWLLRGSGLPDFDVLGETNPYVRCRLLAPGVDDAQAQTSTTKFRTLSPEWYPPERFEFLVPPGVELASCRLVLELCDHKTVRADVEVATGVIAIAKAEAEAKAAAKAEAKAAASTDGPVRRASMRASELRIQLRDARTNAPVEGARLDARLQVARTREDAFALVEQMVWEFGRWGATREGLGTALNSEEHWTIQLPGDPARFASEEVRAFAGEFAAVAPDGHPEAYAVADNWTIVWSERSRDGWQFANRFAAERWFDRLGHDHVVRRRRWRRTLALKEGATVRDDMKHLYNAPCPAVPPGSPPGGGGAPSGGRGPWFGFCRRQE